MATATYQVKFTPFADRQLAKLPENVQVSLVKKIAKLAEHPRPPGIKKMVGSDNFYRLRSGNYRVIYQIQDKLLLVTIVKLGHRREVYD